jgi:GMP synthase (glutamine-hydrolysing)
MHESFESPAAIEIWAKNKGCGITYTKLYEQDTFPQEIEFDFLVIMGGPQSPATTIQECPYLTPKKKRPL